MGSCPKQEMVATARDVEALQRAAHLSLAEKNGRATWLTVMATQYMASTTTPTYTTASRAVKWT